MLINTKFIGHEIIKYKKIDSTQLEIIRRMQNNNIKNGTIIVADVQTNGKRNSWQKMVYY